MAKNVPKDGVCVNFMEKEVQAHLKCRIEGVCVCV